MDAEHGELLDGPQPGPDELRAIVARASRRRWRAAGAAAAVALAAGAGVGYAVSNHSSPAGQTVVASSPTNHGASPQVGTGAAAVAGGKNGAASGPAGVPAPAVEALDHLFTRNAGAVTIRGYSVGTPAASTPSCYYYAGPRFQAEVSTAKTVGTVTSFDYGVAAAQPAATVDDVFAGRVGSAEGDPVDVVLAHTSAQVAQVKVTFAGGGSDTMAPVQGWSALAWETSASPDAASPVGTLTALGPAGQVLSTTTVTFGYNGVLPGRTPLPPEPVAGQGTSGGAGASTGVASSSGGVASAGSVSSGAVSSGSGSSGSGVSSSVGIACPEPVPPVTLPPASLPPASLPPVSRPPNVTLPTVPKQVPPTGALPPSSGNSAG